MTLGPEVDFETLRDGGYEKLSEPLLIAGRDRLQVADFLTQNGIAGHGWVPVGADGWEGFMGLGKILVVLPDALEDEETEAEVRRWVDGEEWTYFAPRESYQLARAEREQDAEEEERWRRHARWWRRAAVAAGAVCGVLAWVSTRYPEASMAVGPWVVAACGWVAAAVVVKE